VFQLAYVVGFCVFRGGFSVSYAVVTEWRRTRCMAGLGEEAGDGSRSSNSSRRAADVLEGLV
jgi:hypothetical protein